MNFITSRRRRRGGERLYFLGIPLWVRNSAADRAKVVYLYKHIPECNRVLAWLEDEESRNAYQGQLMQIHLNFMELPEVEMGRITGMSMHKWNDAVEQVSVLQAKNKLPKIDVGLLDNQSFVKSHLQQLLEYLYATTFVLGQYIYKDFVTIKKDDVVLDCGGCFAETAIWALQKGAAKVYTFEPDPVNIPYVKTNIDSFGGDGRIVLVPNALGAKKDTLSFMHNPENPGGSRLCEDGSAGAMNVEQITLDDWCAENEVIPNFIKMDIEGAEVDALQGASKIIAKHKPQLAISLYHNPSDMWVIPALIKEICPEYRFWCKKNTPDVSEFVLYCSV